MAYSNVTGDTRKVGVPRPLVTMSIPPRKYSTHFALISSFCEPSSCFEKESCDALKEDDIWVDSMTPKSSYL